MNSELQLRDIHLPAEVGWWPPAYGWWILALLLVVLLVLLWQRWRRNRPRPAAQVCGPALLELQRLEREYGSEPGQLIRELSVLLRRSAMSIHGRHRVSGLSGRPWLEFLDKQAGQTIFGERFHTMLTELPYRENAEASAGDLVAGVRQWLHNQQQNRQQNQQQKRRAGHV